MAGLRAVSPRLRALAGAGAALAVVAGTVAVVGFGPFVQGIVAVTPAIIVVAVALAAVATAAAAWRWRIVSAGFGLSLAWGEAVGAYYRSQFLNTVLPGGVVGDIHRAIAHGRSRDSVALAARAVAAERVAGQLVQFVLTLGILLPLGLASSLAPLAWAGGAMLVLIAAAAAVVAALPSGRRLIAKEYRMLRPLLTRPLALLGVVLASAVVVAAHTAVFVVAGLAAGVDGEIADLLLVALVVLAASAIPVNIGGWGPREAVAASAFAVIGLGAGAGLAVSTTFGVLAMAAVIPGAVVLLGDRFRSPGGKGIIGSGRSA
ncbi:lysylphosphatidylglycerol synthase domain-containing protein [Microbacterium atlanticum]|uniref:lysylphosphatidylglycerol synthase domain-containing protein n=1 Tax=Microbacterium atlanticum TaxID=2782168 RepID=UPI00188862C1|nr:lysylphosphatidylglycerol synthase domain-containing protein [Microbacterium atlanticum]